MSVKVYLKKGAKNYKETRLVQKLQSALEKKFAQNPELASNFKPATNFAQLQQLYDEHCVEDATFEDIPNDNKNTTEAKDSYQKHKNFRDSSQQSMAKDTKETEEITAKSGNDDKSLYEDSNDSFIDPLNREEPIVRDYVMSEEFPDTNPNKQPARTSFDEPTSFKDSFEIPDDSNDARPSGNNTGVSNNQQKPKKDKQVAEPVNPNWDDMNNGKKKKSTRKFAKYIVETVCMLTEKGFVWYANKDINDAKLAEYELNDEMDLSLLVTLEEGQQLTVKQFFQMQCMKAEQLAKIEPEEKADLADALAEVLLEKGVGPTPTQELMLISLKIFGGQIVNLISLKSQTNSLLEQLRAMKEQQGGPRPNYTAPQPPPPQPKEEPQQERKAETADVISTQEINEDEQMMQYDNQYSQLPVVQEDNDLGIIETSIETKE
jgi:hypothetical protein